MSTNVRLIHGNCLDEMQKIAGHVSCIVTDPPYGINYSSGLQTGDRRSGQMLVVRERNYFRGIVGDETLPTAWLKVAHSVLKDGGALYAFTHWKSWASLFVAAEEAGFTVKNMVVVNKSNHGMGDLKGSYAPKHELVLFAAKGRHILKRDGGRKKDVMDLPVKYSGSHHHHPNEKPVSWVTPFILESTSTGDVVLDPFMGSGTTGVAALRLKRSFIGIELDKKFFDVAQKRLAAACEEWERSQDCQ